MRSLRVETWVRIRWSGRGKAMGTGVIMRSLFSGKERMRDVNSAKLMEKRELRLEEKSVFLM